MTAGPEAAATPRARTAPSPELARLAEAHRVATEFWDWQGRPVDVSAETLVAVLASLGVDASSPGAVATALRAHEQAPLRDLLPPCLVVREGSADRFAVHVRHGDPVEVWVEPEHGGGRRLLVQQDRPVDPVDVDGTLVGEATYAVPRDLPIGYHLLGASSGARTASTALIVTPGRLELPPAVRAARVWGYLVQLYSVRSKRSWGVGDLADLADLVGWTGRELGVGFVLVNPLHAAEPIPPLSDSPYLPTTRRFPNPIYIRVEAVAEYAYLDAPSRRRVTTLRGKTAGVDGPDGLIDRDRAWSAKIAALRLVHAAPRSIGRQSAYDAFVAREGAGLRDFATWCALASRHGAATSTWPAELRDPGGPAVTAAQVELADDLEFWCWLQWVLDDQLAAAAVAARQAGAPLGVMHDLAVGVHPDGADSWALGSVLAPGVSVGAPPDAFNQLGQDWSQPPWHPTRLAEANYRPWREMLRTVLRHAGGLRVDHVLGLFRLWFVPAGGPASEGTYVRYDHEALVGILALEAHRAGAVVVGEDLGTVEPWVRDYLAERGVLGTSLLWFERDDDGKPSRPEQWRELTLATVGTHDLPPTAAYLSGDHVDLRERLGLLTRPVAEERAADAAARAEWLDLLGTLGLLRPGATSEDVIDALHRLLTQTPCRLLGVQLVDAVGERRTQNQPGTFEEYPNWRLPLADGAGQPLLLEDLPAILRPPF